MFSSKRCRPWRVSALVAVASLPVLVVAAPVTHCHPDEKAFFSCVAGKKTVSLCGQSGADGVASLTYRYGLPGKVEYEYAATPANGNRFLGTGAMELRSFFLTEWKNAAVCIKTVINTG